MVLIMTRDLLVSTKPNPLTNFLMESWIEVLQSEFLYKLLMVATKVDLKTEELLQMLILMLFLLSLSNPRNMLATN